MATEGRRKRGLRAAIALAVIAAILLGGRELGRNLPSFVAWVDGRGAFGPIVFIAGYAAAIVAFVPGSILTLAGGLIFGLAEGTAYVFVAAVIGSSVAFALARTFARRRVAGWIEGDVRFSAIDRAVAREGRKFVFLLRLSPLFPFSLLNYALGLTRVRIFDYTLGSLGMLPWTFLYVYLGRVVGDLAAVPSGAASLPDWASWLGLAVTLAVTLWITQLARRALAAVTELEEESP